MGLATIELRRGTAPSESVGDSATPPPAATGPAAASDAGRPPLPNGVLRGHATYKGAGPWMVLTVHNDESFDWTKCTVTLPGGLTYNLNQLRAGDHESIALSNFTQQGPERDLPRESTTVRCTQGASKFMFPPD